MLVALSDPESVANILIIPIVMLHCDLKRCECDIIY